MTAPLAAYFARIGYTGSREPTLETLRGLVLAHVQAIPFENLDVLLGRSIELDDDAIAAKLVHARRGGYCFEQNGLLLAVLTQLGFAVEPLSARVRLQRPRDSVPPRTHMFVRVEIDGVPWLADVGVGGLSPTAPLRLDTEDAQATPHDTRRILRENARLYHQVLLKGEWQDVCEFTLEDMPRIDRELANWYTSAHPQSHFKNRLLVARAGPAAQRFTLLNHEFTHRRSDGSVRSATIATPEQLLEVLDEHFGLRFPPQTRFACSALAWNELGARA